MLVYQRVTVPFEDGVLPTTDFSVRKFGMVTNIDRWMAHPTRGKTSQTGIVSSHLWKSHILWKSMV